MGGGGGGHCLSPQDGSVVRLRAWARESVVEGMGEDVGKGEGEGVGEDGV